MYVPKHFEASDPALLWPLVERFSFATLVTAENGVPFATHLPFIVRPEQGVLAGHVARANPQWRHFGGSQALAIFQGDHAYVSPSWYSTSPNVPTWNYVAIHAYGVPRIVEDEETVYGMLGELTKVHEGHREAPWTPRAAEDYVRKLMKGIVTFEIEVARLEGKFKLGQNKTPADRAGVVGALEGSADPAERGTAEAMRELP